MLDLCFLAECLIGIYEKKTIPVQGRSVFCSSLSITVHPLNLTKVLRIFIIPAMVLV
uniref:Uncharacterized protein n=1 Tax=Octopus bimaculoides TaxID=37653 RepID=A0A0L8GDN1_OCTBM